MAAGLLQALPPAMDGRVIMSAQEQQAARCAAVLVALVVDAAQVQVLLTRRTEHLSAHAGQISFAGGRVAASDADHVATALREAQEEIGLEPSRVQVLGRLPDFLVPTGFRVTPVLAWLPERPPLRADPDEVAEIFYLPASIGLDPGAWRQEEIVRNGRQHRVWAIDYEGRHIWGATAAILVWLGGWLRSLDIRL